MEKYDFAKAHDFIEAEKEILAEAALGMHEDWFWTAETIWKNGKYAVNLATATKIAGISGSSWATPVIKLEYKDGKVRFLECCKGESSGTKPDFLELGVFSGLVQGSIPPIEK